MKKSPTDLQILDSIYERYYDVYAAYSEENGSRSSKIYVPIDIPKLAKDMGVDVDIIFGRLYYHLNQKYGYKQDNGSHVYFFTPKAGGDSNCINFPYLASVLASLRDESRKYRVATWIAVCSLILSIVALLVSIFA